MLRRLHPALETLRRHGDWIVLAAVVCWMTWLRLHLVAAGPDLDTDAIAHARIARRLLEEWRDVRVHWVWLPVWHLVGAAVFRLGGTLHTLRLVSIALSALAPFLLVATLRGDRTRRAAVTAWLVPAERVLPLAAGVVCALWPLGLAVGEAAQPEALFQCLVLTLCLAWERGHPAWTGVLLALAVLLRYEAWPLPAVFAALWWRDRPRTWRGALAWALPGVAIAGWCGLHYAVTREPFQFLRLNGEFIRQAWIDLRLLEQRPAGVRHPWAWYLAIVPWFSVRWALLWVLPGLAWFVWRAPRSYRWIAALLLVLLTALWVRRVNLGLHRHFAVLVPFYATALAAGLCGSVAWVAARVRIRPAYVVGLVLLALLLQGRWLVWKRVLPQARLLEQRQAVAFLPERRVIAVLKAHLGPRGRVFCDRQAVEVLSDLPPWRFIHWQAPAVRPYNLYIEAAQRGRALVVSTPARVAHLRSEARTLHDDGRLVLLRRDGSATPDPQALRQPVAR